MLVVRNICLKQVTVRLIWQHTAGHTIWPGGPLQLVCEQQSKSFLLATNIQYSHF